MHKQILTIKNWRIHKDDTVSILLGKDRGKTGKVIRIDNKKGKVIVEGINVYKRHVRKMGGVDGGIVDVVKPVNVSNVMLVCPSCKKLTRVAIEVKNGEKQRVCKKCKKEITKK